jgi:colicin import membrane protein
LRSIGVRGVTVLTILTFIFAPLGKGEKTNKIVGKTVQKATIQCVVGTPCPAARTIVRAKYVRGAKARRGDTTKARAAVAAYRVSSRKAAARKAVARKRAAARKAAAKKRAVRRAAEKRAAAKAARRTR